LTSLNDKDNNVSSAIVFRNTLIVIATVAGAYLLFISHNIIVVLVIAIIIASAIRPMILRLQKWGLSQGFAIAIIYGVLIFAFLGLTFLVLPPMVNQFTSYLQNEDRLATRLIFAQNVTREFFNRTLGFEIPTASPDLIRTSVSDVLNHLTTTGPTLLQQALNSVSDGILALIMGIYWLATRDRAVDFVVQLFPLKHRALTEQVFNEVEVGMGLYMRGIVMVSVIIGFLNFLALQLLGVTNAAALGFVMGVCTAIPIVGGLIGVVAVTLIALIASPLEAVLVFGVAAVIQQIENYIVSPRVMASGVGFDTILVFLFVAIGFTVGGIAGALIAVPIAGALYVLAKYLIIEPRRQDVQPEFVDGGVLLEPKTRAEKEKEREREREKEAEKENGEKRILLPDNGNNNTK
jgi:predicted PurR-regulated permease PerM